MLDIKTREVRKGYVKTIDRAAGLSEHVRNAGIKVKGYGEHGSENDNSDASSYADDRVVDAAERAESISARAGEAGARRIHEMSKNVEEGRRRSASGSGASGGITNGSVSYGSDGFDREGREVSDSVGNGRFRSENVISGRLRSENVGKGRKRSFFVEGNRGKPDPVERGRRMAQKAEENRKRAKRIEATARTAKRGTRKALIVAYRALRAAIESSKAMVTMLLAGGWIVVIVIIVCILFGAAFYFFGDESSSNYTPVSPEVEAYTALIEKYAGEYGIPEYVDLIKAVMMQESGGSGNDPMQCSESPYNKKYSNKPGGIKDPEYSVNCGIHYLADCLKSAKCETPLDMDRIRLAIQGYNFGNGYIPWAIKRDGGYTVQNAAIFSKQQAKKHGWKSYGDKLYATHVLRYYPYGNYNYGIGNNEIIAVAAKQLGNVGGDKFWRWYGFTSHVGWCACFVSWCSDQCGYIKAGIVPKYANVRVGIRWFQQKNQWQRRGYKPAAGDVIFFDWNGDGLGDHVGLVEKCDGGRVHTIEGNTSNSCRRKTYGVNSGVILGYGIPKY